MKNAKVLLLSNGFCALSSFILLLLSFLYPKCKWDIFQSVVSGMLASAVISFIPSFFVYRQGHQDAMDALVKQYKEIMERLESSFSGQGLRTVDKATILLEISLLHPYVMEATSLSRKSNQKLNSLISVLRQIKPNTGLDGFHKIECSADDIINDLCSVAKNKR